MKKAAAQTELEMPKTDGKPAAADERAFNPISRMIPRLQLAPWADQPRQDFPKEAQEELRASMKEHGFDEAFPLLCRPLEYRVVVSPEIANGYHLDYRTHPSSEWRGVQNDFEFPATASWRYLLTQGDPNSDVELALAWLPKFQIVDGQRRWTEAGELNIHEVPCVVREMSDSEALEKALISALQKRSLNVLEQAEGFGRLIEYGGGGHSAKSIAHRLGLNERTVKDRLDLRALRGTYAGDC